MSGTGRRRKPPTGEEAAEQHGAQQPYQGPSSGQYETYAAAAEPQYDYDWRQPGGSGQSPAQSPSSPAAPSSGEPAAFDAFSPYGQGGRGNLGQIGGGLGQSYDRQTPAALPAAPAAPTVPAQPDYDRRPGYDGQQPGYDSGTGYGRRPGDDQPLDAYGYPSTASAVPAPPMPGAPIPDAPAPAPAAPAPEPQTAPRRPGGGAESDFKFEFDLDDDDERSSSAAQDYASAAQGYPAADPEAIAEPDGAPSGRVDDKDGYRAHDFDFVDAANDVDVNGWLSFSESRADSRAERIRKLRFRLIAIGAVLALVGAGVGVYVLFGGAVPGLNGPAQPAKSMIMLRLEDPASGNAVGDALLITKRDGADQGSQAAGTGDIVVIPPQLQVQTSGFGGQPFGGDMTGTNKQPPAGPDDVSDLLGVTPDGTWNIDEITFGLFIDELGGLQLTTNTAVPPSAADPKGVPAGPGTLAGVQAVAYATYLANGEAPGVQAARFGQVIGALMQKLPSSSVSINAYLNALALLPDPDLPLSKLSPILAAIAAQENAGKVTTAALPLSTDGSDSLDYSAASPIITGMLGGTAKAGQPAGQAARVLVQNGTGASPGDSPKLLADAQAKLADAGLTYNPGDTVAVQPHSVVEVATSSDQALGEQVAACLGLSGASVQVVSGLSEVDDVTVVLGQDWTTLGGQ